MKQNSSKTLNDKTIPNSKIRINPFQSGIQTTIHQSTWFGLFLFGKCWKIFDFSKRKSHSTQFFGEQTVFFFLLQLKRSIVSFRKRIRCVSERKFAKVNRSHHLRVPATKSLSRMHFILPFSQPKNHELRMEYWNVNSHISKALSAREREKKTTHQMHNAQLHFHFIALQHKNE